MSRPGGAGSKQKIMEAGDTCPKCDYGVLTAETKDVGVSKEAKQRILSCGNVGCTFSEIK